MLAGYDRQNKVQETCKRLMEALNNPQLPYLELQVRTARVPASTEPRCVADGAGSARGGT